MTGAQIDEIFKSKNPLDQLTTEIGADKNAFASLKGLDRGQQKDRILALYNKARAFIGESEDNMAKATTDSSVAIKKLIQDLQIEASVRKLINAEQDKANNAQYSFDVQSSLCIYMCT